MRIALNSYETVRETRNVCAKLVALLYNPRYESGRAAQTPITPNAPAHLNKARKGDFSMGDIFPVKRIHGLLPVQSFRL